MTSVSSAVSGARLVMGQSVLGAVQVVTGDGGVAAIMLGDDPVALHDAALKRFPDAVPAGKAEADRVLAAVRTCIETPWATFGLPLDMRGTPFQCRVWQALRAIPCGGTATYTELAAHIGRPEAVRAVAGACGANPLAVVIPCHRVIRRDGSLSGYRWGVSRKQWLLDRERTGMARGQ